MDLKTKYVLILFAIQFNWSCKSNIQKDSNSIKMEFSLNGETKLDAELIPTNNPESSDQEFVFQLLLNNSYQFNDGNLRLKDQVKRYWYLLDLDGNRNVLEIDKPILNYKAISLGLSKIMLCYQEKSIMSCASRFISTKERPTGEIKSSYVHAISLPKDQIIISSSSKKFPCDTIDFQVTELEGILYDLPKGKYLAKVRENELTNEYTISSNGNSETTWKWQKKYYPAPKGFYVELYDDKKLICIKRQSN
ncbi:MAG: hypothetical protein WBB02_03970 [Saprospiraceae bacterium]